MKDKDMLIIKPILMTFLSTSAVKNLIIQLLEAYAKSTDNTIDDKAVEIVRRNLFPGIKDDQIQKEKKKQIKNYTRSQSTRSGRNTKQKEKKKI